MNRPRHGCMIPALTLALLWASSSAAQQHKPIPPYRCSGQTDKVLSGIEISTPGVAVEVTSNCTLTIRNSRIHGGKVAIKVTGNGTLNIIKATVESHKVAVLTAGNGTTNARGSTFYGKSQVAGNGDFNNNGGNTFHKKGRKVKGPIARAEAPAAPGGEPVAPKKKYKKHGVIKCVGAGHRTLKGRSIITAGTAIKVMGSCKVTLINCRIEAGKAAVSVVGSGVVVLHDSTIKGRRAAIKIVGTGSVKAKDSRIIGGIKVVGTGAFINLGGNTIK